MGMAMAKATAFNLMRAHAPQLTHPLRLWSVSLCR